MRPDDTFEYNGYEFNEVVLVGRVFNKSEIASRVQLEFTDNTGTIKVFFYVKEDNQTPQALKGFQYDEMCYAKLYGALRIFND